ncbi:MAG: hypothetical protein R6U93_03695 [Dehalococcoidia bacterium]
MGLVGCETEPTPDDTIELDFVTFWPLVDFQARGESAMYGYTDMGHWAWARAIENKVAADTEYEVEITVTTVPNPYAIWNGVQAGTYDIGATGPGYTPGIMKLWEGPEYPAALNRTNAYAMSMQLQKLYDEFAPLQAQMTAANVEVMHFWSTGPGYFLMTAGNNVTTLAEFGALTKPIRAANPASVKTIEALGAEALAVAMSGALLEFEAGNLAGILCPTDTPKGFGLGAYVRMGTFAPFSYQFVFMKVMNKTTWASLPEEVQAVFDAVNAAWPAYYGQLRTWGEADGLQYCFDEIEGFTMYDIATADPTEYQNWVDACYPGLIDGWIAAEDTTNRQALWDMFVALDAEMEEFYGDWTPSAAPPTPPF